MGGDPKAQAAFAAETKRLQQARLHKTISYVKSGLRIGGYVWLPISIVAGVIILVIAEGLGFAEEIWGA